jgi:hypothetical protein
MSITIDLPQELLSELSTEAERLGLSLSDYVVRMLSLARGKRPKLGAELIEYWQSEGLIGSRTDVTDSQEYARQLREQAEHRTFM